MKAGEPLGPWELVSAHRYREALTALNRLVRRDPHNYRHRARRAMANLCLSKLDDAFTDFMLSRKLHQEQAPAWDRGTEEFESVATVDWLRGNVADAIHMLRSAVEGILDGTISYTDLAGGVGPGLLLWFMGLRANDGDATEHAIRYLKRLSKRRRIKSWPGPLALYALGKLSFEDVLYEVGGPHDSEMWTNVDGVMCRMNTLGGSRDLATVRRWAETDLRRRRELCQALFYRGAKALADGDAKGYAWWMGECCALENPIVEMEWYIARHEARKLKQAPAET